MNKYKEAYRKVGGYISNSIHASHKDTYRKRWEAGYSLNELEELVEKATPKKAEETHYAPYHTFCSVCGGLVFDNFNYCPKCGQALDWSEEDA